MAPHGLPEPLPSDLCLGPFSWLDTAPPPWVKPATQSVQLCQFYLLNAGPSPASPDPFLRLHRTGHSYLGAPQPRAPRQPPDALSHPPYAEPPTKHRVYWGSHCSTRLPWALKG